MNVIQQAESKKKELDALRPLKKEDELRIIQKFRLDWNYHSNHLEGNSLTYGETKALILFGITAQGKPLKDHFEITGHNEAINWVLDVVKEDRPLTESFIRELHKLLLKEPYESDAITPDGQPTKKRIQIGVYKTTPNHVKTKTGEIFRFATPEETPAEMEKLINWYRAEKEKPDTHPILLAALFHYRFIRIHPFDDGNGRTVRILMNFILMQYGYPPVIIKTEDKTNYFAALQQADAGVMEPFIEYIAKNLIHSLDIMIKGAKGESVEEPGDLEKEIALLKQEFESSESDRFSSFKSAGLIIDVYNHSIIKTIESFMEEGLKMREFYKTLYFSVEYGHSKPINIRSKAHAIVSTKYIQGNINGIIIKYEYKKFIYGFHEEEIDYSSRINFEFKDKFYQARLPGEDALFKKGYGEFLSDEEVKRLVDSAIRKHIEFVK